MLQFRPLCAVLTLVLAASTLHAEGPATRPAYPLKVDVVSGAPLPADGGIVEKIDGREVRFATPENAAAFKAGGEASQKKMDELVAATELPNYKATLCPVTDEKLGEMGKPVQFVDRSTNRLIQLCCGGCLKKAKANPAAMLEKIDAEVAKK